MTTYGYTRTSTKDKQHDDLQRRALVDAGVNSRQIHADQVSGSKQARAWSGWAALDERLRDGDQLVVWRVDRIGRSLTDGIDPSTREGRLMLNLMATFSEYERELIQERVQAGVNNARANGKRFGRPPVDPVVVARKLRIIDQLVADEGISVAEAARTQGWSKATYYRHRGKASAEHRLHRPAAGADRALRPAPGHRGQQRLRRGVAEGLLHPIPQHWNR